MTDTPEIPPEFKDLMDVFGGEPEDLHPDLVPYVTEGVAGTMLHHPLVIQLFFHAPLHKLANRQYRQKLVAVEQAQEQGNWSSYIFLHERPYRLGAFMEIEPDLSNEEYWSLLSGIWIDSESISLDQSEWFDLLTARTLPHRITSDRYLWFMDDHDRRAFDNLPEMVNVYRGVDVGGNEGGLSWTVNKERAEWFARRFHGHGTVLSARVPKWSIMAMLVGRGESEVITRVDPKLIRRSKVTPK